MTVDNNTRSPTRRGVFTLAAAGAAVIAAPSILPGRAHAAAGPRGRRPVYFGGAGGTVEAQVYERTALAPGFAATGPALIEEYGSTTLVWPGDRFEIGKLGEIRIHCAGS